MVPFAFRSGIVTDEGQVIYLQAKDNSRIAQLQVTG